MHWFKSLLLNSTLLRKSFFPLLKKIDFKVIVKQYLMNHPLYLKLWGHKGYWFYRADRESEEIIPFSKLIKRRDSVLDVGSHIGYVAQYFEKIIGPKRTLVCVEPTKENLDLLERNIHSSTIVVDTWISNQTEDALFNTNFYGGFTNSLERAFVPDFIKIDIEVQEYHALFRRG